MKIVSATTPTGIRLVREGSGFVVQKSNTPFNQMSLTYGGRRDTLDKPYQESVWVMRAIKRVADPISGVPLEFFADRRGGEQEVKDATLEEFWAAPGIDRSGRIGLADFIEATVGWLKLRGECFWIMGDEWLTRGAARGALLIARPDRMRPIVREGMVIGWDFRDANGHGHALLREQVMHLKFWNPYDDLRGLAEYDAARIAAEADYEAGKFGRNLMKANGDQGVIVVTKEGVPTDEQQTQIVAMLRARMDAASRGEFRPMFFPSNVAIEDPKMQGLDAAVVAQRLQNRHEIFIAFGVPPSMADVQASYSVGSASDRYLLIRDTCIPLANGKIADGIEAVTARLVGRQLKACFNFRLHDVMQQVMRESVDSVTKLWGTGVPMAQLNDVFGLGLREFDGWEKSYLPFSVAAVGESEPEPEDDLPPIEDTPEPDAVDKMLAVLRARDPVEKMKLALADAPAIQIGARSGRDPERVKLWNSYMRRRASAVKRCRSKVTKALMTARAETLAKIAKDGPLLLGKAAASDFVFDLERFGKVLMQEMRKAAAATLQEAGTQLFAEIGKDDVYSMPPARALKFIANRENRIKDASAEIFERIQRTLTEGITAGDSTAKLAGRVKAEFGEIEDGRALTIAQTETSAAYGEARQDAADQAGVEWKEWLTSGLGNVRVGHLKAEGQRVRMNDPFLVDNAAGIAEPLMYPGDPAGAPDNVINCHCVSIPVADSGEENS